MDKPLYWGNLLDRRCPKCEARLIGDKRGLICFVRCGFFIKKERFKELVGRMGEPSMSLGFAARTIPGLAAQQKERDFIKQRKKND